MGVIKIFKNSFYDTRQSTIHIWEQINGEDLYDKFQWVPYVFVKSIGDRVNAETIDGNPVMRKDFYTYQDYYDYQQNNFCFENKVRPEIQFLSERYYEIPDDEVKVPALTIYSIDIEVLANKGFPDAKKAIDPITIISYTNNKTKRTKSFGVKKYTGNMKSIDYVECKNEKEVLKKFFLYMHKHPCDVLSGWNIWNFDLPYIINRSKILFKISPHVLMSPIKIVKTWKQKNSDEINIDIAGVCILDYFSVYKWYSPNKLENYTLGYVSEVELGVGKLDYSDYDSLSDLFERNWDLYVDYNVIDCERVDQLEDKLGYVKLIQALSLLTKTPMKYYNVMTQLIEGAMLAYFRRNDLCAPTFMGGTQETFEAAYVKEPQKGMHNWVTSVDITSSYPSHIITLNMSVETYIGRIMGLKESYIISCVNNKEFMPFDMFKENKGIVKMDGRSLSNFNKVLKRGLIAIAPCGSVFSTGKKGVIAEVEKNVFFKRKEIKKLMIDMRNQASQMHEGKERDGVLERAQELFSYQWALKIWLNAVFGALAVPYSRFFNTNIAEAITSCGRNTIKSGEKFINEFLNKPDSNLKKVLAEIE